VYVLQNTVDGNLQPRIFYNRLDFLVGHPGFKPTIKALLILLELSDNEEEFNLHYQKVHAAYLNNGACIDIYDRRQTLTSAVQKLTGYFGMIVGQIDT
jgi:hypothetical protein